MSVDVDPVRIIDTPTELVHGPGALARLGELVLREIGGPSDYDEIWRAAFARGR